MSHNPQTILIFLIGNLLKIKSKINQTINIGYVKNILLIEGKINIYLIRRFGNPTII